ncbi:MAG TPA: guanylate kinase [Verrucomicrobiae bacterium]|nr:guanylate kinase [Verrucomicrobiae bacterium]
MTSSTGNQLPVFVITGQSGAGKGTLIKRLLALFPQLELAVSATTRARRPGEVEGIHYYFISDEEFDRRLEDGDFLEYHVFPWGQRSGTLLSEIDRIGEEGKVCVLELETEGALNVAERVPGAVTIFITAPIEELERRLLERATESSGEIGERLRVAREQRTVADRFDYIVENDDLERAVGELSGLIRRHAVPAGTMPQP